MDGPTRGVTLADVAAAAGVSAATASRALNGGDRRVRPELQARVMEAAQRLNYRVNLQARAVARGRTDTVGLLVHDIADVFFASIAAGVIEEADRHELLVSLASTQRSQEREARHIAALSGQRARAAIIVGSRFDHPTTLHRLEREIRDFERAGGRVALVSQALLGVDSVVMENRSSAQSMGHRLAQLGYRRFAILAAQPELLTSNERVEGFRQAVQDRGLPEPVVGTGEFTRAGGYDAMMDLLDRGLEADCVFAVSDVMAIGAMAALRARGIRLPDDIAVAGFDDIVTARDVTPGLTTVRVPLEEMGRTALQMAIQERQDPPRLHRVRGEVILRSSTPPRH